MQAIINTKNNSSSPKKILIIGFIPPPLEGTSIITQLLYDKQDFLQEKSGTKISFLFLYTRTNSANRGKLALTNIMLNLLNLTRFIIKVILFRPQIVYQPLAQNKIGFVRDSIFIIISRLSGAKSIVHFHGGSFDKFYHITSGKLFKKYIAIIMPLVTRVICLAQTLTNQFTKHLPKERTTFIYNYAPQVSKELIHNKKTPDNPIFLYMGYISRAKGCVDIVKAALKVISQRPQAKFVLCGQPIDIEKNITFISQPHGGYSEILSLLKKPGIQHDAIKLLPPVEGKVKEELLKNAYAFVYPSYSEGCPMAIMEAISYGLPLLITPVGALPEMFVNNKNCFFVEPGNNDKLADKIIYLIDNPQIAQDMGKNNLEAALNIYCQSNFLNKFADVVLQ